jgi:hypothetical protein
VYCNTHGILLATDELFPPVSTPQPARLAVFVNDVPRIISAPVDVDGNPNLHPHSGKACGGDDTPASLQEMAQFAVVMRDVGIKHIDGSDGVDKKWLDVACTLATCDNSLPYRTGAFCKGLHQFLKQKTAV